MSELKTDPILAQPVDHLVARVPGPANNTKDLINRYPDLTHVAYHSQLGSTPLSEKIKTDGLQHFNLGHPASVYLNLLQLGAALRQMSDI